MSHNEPSIFDYLDYRDFMLDWFKYKKYVQPFYSYTYIGQKIDLDKSQIARIFMKSRHLADPSIPKVTAFLQLSEVEISYFETLVCFGKARSDADAKRAFDFLLSLRNANAKPITQDQVSYYQYWYHPVMRSLLDIVDVKMNPDPETLAKLAKAFHPTIESDDVLESINLLLRLQMVVPNEVGNLKPTDAGLRLASGWSSALIRLYQQSTLQIAIRAFDEIPKELRGFSSLTMNVGPHEFAEIKRRLDEFRNSLTSFLAQSGKGDSVYHLALNLWPLAIVANEESDL